MLKGKILLEYTNLFSANKYKNNDKAKQRHFLYNLKKVKMKKNLQFYLW